MRSRLHSSENEVRLLNLEAARRSGSARRCGLRLVASFIKAKRSCLESSTDKALRVSLFSRRWMTWSMAAMPLSRRRILASLFKDALKPA